MRRAAVPKATVNEHRQPMFRKDEIRAAEHSSTTAPSRDSMTAKCFHQSDLGGPVAATSHTRHDL